MNRLKTSLGKLSMANPVTVASGTFGTEYQEFYDLNILGAYVSKTITRYPKEGNPPPRLFETEAGLLNSIGLQNPGLNAFIQDVLPDLKNTLHVPIIVSISGSTMDEFAEMLMALEEEDGIAAYEINISCPNVENEGIAFGMNAEVVHKLTSILADISTRELIVKLSPNVTDITEIAMAAQDGGADSLALINTLYGMAIDYRTGKSRIKRGISGYSGIAVKPVAVALTYKVAQKVSIPILAMGGIYNWMDALEFIYAGASAIAIGTGNFIDPCACPNMIENLGQFLEETNTTIEDIVGKVCL